MTAMMTARGENTGLVLGQLVAMGFEIRIWRHRDKPIVTVLVERDGVPSRWYDAGTLDACVGQMGELLRQPGSGRG